MLGLPIESFVLLFVLPAAALAPMFYFGRRLKKGTWD